MRCAAHFSHPVQQIGVLRIERIEPPALERGGLRVLDGALHGPLAVGIAHARRIGHDAIVGEHRAIEAIELRLVDVRRDHPLFEVVQDHVLRAAAKVAKRLLVQPRPSLAARFPHHPAIRAPRVTQRHHKQPRFAVTAADTARVERRGAFAVIDLCLFPGQELQAVELLGLAPAQPPAEALDAVVALRESKPIHQLLVDGHGVAAQAHLGFDPLPMRFARRARVRRQPLAGNRRSAGLASRWPGWGNLTRQAFRAGGRGGGI